MSNTVLQWVSLAKQGDDAAFEKLLVEYKHLVSGLCRRYFLIGGDKDDLMQEGMIGLYKAVKTFDTNKTANFNTYATTVIERQLINAIKQANTQKNEPLSAYTTLSGQNDEEPVLAYHENSPETRMLNQDDIKNKLKQIATTLSPFEMKVLESYLDGNSYIQIAELLHKSTKSIDNALNRIKTKLKFLNTKE